MMRKAIVAFARKLAFAAMLMGTLASLARQADAQALVVRTAEGSVVGAVTGADRMIAVFRGIPYAAPPVGVRRWRPAEPTPAWSEPLVADRFGPDCMQTSTMDVLTHPERDFFYHPPSLTSEDCLYLNVWTPAQRELAKLPVMVWIHGGGEVQGSGSWPLYDGAALARKGVVLVTLNYRLGIFGRFALAELTAESPQHSSGAYDVSDLIQALRWVHSNIGAFGGDPDNVTIFGQSSGAMYVAALMTAPLARGLFSKAIGESGFAFYDPVLTLSAAEAKSRSFASSISQPTLAGLRDMPAADLLRLSRTAGFSLNLPVDGYFIPAAPCDVFSRGQQQPVPLLTGFTADEQFGWQPPLLKIGSYAEYEHAARKLFGYYGGPNVADAFLSMVPRARWRPDMAEPILRGYGMTGWQNESWAEAMSRVTPNVYFYYFDHVPRGAGSAFHTAEISYVFDNERSASRYSPNMPALAPRASDLKLADVMSDYWVSFAKAGMPSAKDGPAWQRYGSRSDRRVMEFRDGVAQPLRDFFREIAFRNLCEIGK